MVEIGITDRDAGSTADPAVTLSAASNPVPEGDPVTITATLSPGLPTEVTIPLILTAGAAEPEDYGRLASIRSRAGETVGTGTIATTEDADTDDETFTVKLGTLPSGLSAGAPGSVQVGTRDDDEPEPESPSVRLSASPNPVPEAGSLTVTVTMEPTPGSDVTIPLSVTTRTAEPEDCSAPAGVTITAGTTFGTARAAGELDRHSSGQPPDRPARARAESGRRATCTGGGSCARSPMRRRARIAVAERGKLGGSSSSPTSSRTGRRLHGGPHGDTPGRQRYGGRPGASADPCLLAVSDRT